MSNPWSINRCKNCGQLYCEECSEAHNYGDYCSPKCEREAAEEALKGVGK